MPPRKVSLYVIVVRTIEYYFRGGVLGYGPLEYQIPSLNRGDRIRFMGSV